jgi:hypothetical protein
MKIKNLENAETLPMKESMRRSSEYDSWDCNHVCGRGYYSWLKGFVTKSVGQPFNDVYSKFKKSLSRKHVDSETKHELIEYFRGLIETRRYKGYWIADYYVDEDGILCKEPRKAKSRDVTIRYGEPVTEYKIKGEYREALFSYLTISFGYKKACSMIKNGITEKEFRAETNEVRRYNNLIYQKFYDENNFNWYNMCWVSLWIGYSTYPYSVTLKYRSREYYKYWYERQDATRKYQQERYHELIDRFNRCELQHSEHPFLIE